MRTLAEELAELKVGGRKIVLVSSGAVVLGRAYLGFGTSARLEQKQAAAAGGQSLLVQRWQEAFAGFGIPVAQLLLTLEDTEQRRRWLNARATLEVLLANGAVPVVNENDSVATEELRYGDNDRLSARTAQMIRSDLLILLSDVDGLYTADPSVRPEAQHIPSVDQIDDVVEAYASGADPGGVGSGGMHSKLMAARIAQGSGCATIIASGKESYPIRRLQDGARSTVFTAAGTPASAYKQWIKGTLHPAGALVIDEGAAGALLRGKSLLPAGISAAEGAFERGACVSIRNEQGFELARGIAGYSAEEVRRIRGCATTSIETRLGFRRADEIVHRNDMVLL